jgi:hypothetical protein
MKIRLTESQYKRLLKEDDEHFLDGAYSFKNIGNKIDRYIAKLFAKLNQEGFEKSTEFLDSIYYSSNPLYEPYFQKLLKRIMLLMGYEEKEAVLLAYNYLMVYWDEVNELVQNGDVSSLIGKPLTFYGNFRHPVTTYFTGYITGYGIGEVTAYATSPDDFIDKVRENNNDVEDNTSDIDFDCYDVHWEYDSDGTSNMLDNVEFDDDEIYVK